MANELHYLLRRAETEAIAAIRSINAVASARHEAMASTYSARARSLLMQSVDRQL